MLEQGRAAAASVSKMPPENEESPLRGASIQDSVFSEPKTEHVCWEPEETEAFGREAFLEPEGVGKNG